MVHARNSNRCRNAFVTPCIGDVPSGDLVRLLVPCDSCHGNEQTPIGWIVKLIRRSDLVLLGDSSPADGSAWSQGSSSSGGGLCKQGTVMRT
ncbi:hypothetical protein ZHAS_00007707 [Anopheles sinensis]|uniref:Uncharacterized protein n=1 Tax=Anopheles sinensis TaxID=74873 RepID=A0A084VQC3_ANOSI|nr:hypothetical protein ZHAS_00007707 [Anopheles sinensis]